MARQKAKYSDCRIALIFWKDAFTRDPWLDESEVGETPYVKCASIGFFVKESEHGVTLVHTVTNDKGACGELTVPREWAKFILLPKSISKLIIKWLEWAAK